MRFRFSLLRTSLVAGALIPLLALSDAAAQRPNAAWRADLLKAARAASFGGERTPVVDASVPRGFSTAGIPDVTFAPTTGTRGKVGIAGRITSKSAYPRLGIPAGVSYLWVDTQKPVRMAIIPADASQPAYWFPTTTHESLVGSAAKSNELCKGNSLATQLGTRRPTGGTQLLMGACTCVDGVWMHAEGSGFEMTELTSRVLLAR